MTSPPPPIDFLPLLQSLKLANSGGIRIISGEEELLPLVADMYKVEHSQWSSQSTLRTSSFNPV